MLLPREITAAVRAATRHSRSARQCCAPRRTSWSRPRSRSTPHRGALAGDAKDRARRDRRRDPRRAPVAPRRASRAFARAPGPRAGASCSASGCPLRRSPSTKWSGQPRNPLSIVDKATSADYDRGRSAELPLEAVMSHEVWKEIYDRLVSLIESHRTTLASVNTRRLAERMAHQLSERLGAEYVAAHHGSLARKEARLDAEERLRSGKLKVLAGTRVAGAGIDIGHVDLVLPDLLAPPHRDLPAAVGARATPSRACRRADLPAHARRSHRVRRWCARCTMASSTGWPCPTSPRRAGAADRCGSLGRRWARTRLALFKQAYPYRTLEKSCSWTWWRCLRAGRRGALIHYDNEQADPEVGKGCA